LFGDAFTGLEESNLANTLFISELLLQVDCESDALLAFGDSGGYAHVWGASEHALVNLHSLTTEVSLTLKQVHIYMAFVLKVLEVVDLTFVICGTNH
jgi:hypothetical protein